MSHSLNPIDLGLRMIEDRRQLLIRAKVSEQIRLAQDPWREALHTLTNYPDVVTILDGLYPHVLPYLIKGYDVSLVHHIAYAVKFIALITTSEDLDYNDVKRGVVAAFLHDIGIGDSILGKITEKMIENAPSESRERLRKKGIAARREHMENGVSISRRLLQDYGIRHPQAISDEDINIILDIVGTHDNSKIPMMEEKVDRKWLLRPDKADWLKQCHWEADALWMLTPAGILVDLQREGYEDTPKNRKERFTFNFDLHKKIVTLYDKAYPDEIDTFAFKGGTLYRTQAGYAEAMKLKRDAESI